MRKDVPHPATPREISRVLKVPRDERNEFKRNLRNLVNDGSLIQIKGNRYGLPDRMDLVVGKLDGHPSGFGFVAPEKPVEGLTRDIYVPEHGMQDAMHGDRVVVRIERYREDGQREHQFQIAAALALTRDTDRGLAAGDDAGRPWSVRDQIAGAT